jgi:hypothetical protein
MLLNGIGGTGAEPFLNGIGGTGAEPFLNGIGGTGAEPFLAIITELSLCAATTVLRLIAPTKTSMARRRDASLRDILPPR